MVLLLPDTSPPSICKRAPRGGGKLKRAVTRAETTFRLSVKRTSPFKSVGASVQSTPGSRGVRISGSNAGYTMFRGRVKSTGYPLHSPVSPSPPLPCVTVCHHISTGVYQQPSLALLYYPSHCRVRCFETGRSPFWISDTTSVIMIRVFLGAFAKFPNSDCWLHHVCVFVCPHATSLLHRIWGLRIFRKIVERTEVWLKSEQNNCFFLHEDLRTFRTTSLLILLRMRNVSGESCRENQNTPFLFNNDYQKLILFVRWCGKIL